MLPFSFLGSHQRLQERSPIVKELYEEPIPRSIERPSKYIAYAQFDVWFVSLTLFSIVLEL